MFTIINSFILGGLSRWCMLGLLGRVWLLSLVKLLLLNVLILLFIKYAIKCIKTANKDIYNVTKYLYFK